MSDLLQRAQEAMKLAGDPWLPKWQRLSLALHAFSGLVLTELSDDVRGPLETDLVSVNRVLEQYPLQLVDDYQIISDADLQQMLNIVGTTASRAIAAELDRIVADLDAAGTKLPVEAIREARAHRDLMIPKLIAALEDATSAARAGNLPKGNAQFFAVFLLTEFQAEAAFPAILAAFSLPGGLPFELFGDAVTSTLAQVLAFFAADRPDVLDTLIGNRELNQSVRWEAAHSYVHLVRDGHIHRDDAVRRLQRQLRQAIDREDGPAISGLICELLSFAPKEALEDIREAYQRDMVDTFLVDSESVERSIAEGEARVRRELARCSATGIADTIEELRRWVSFKEKPAQRPAPPPPPPPPPHFATLREPAEPLIAPVSSRGPRRGRNDPCSCGSGKKFKKCCGARR